MDKRQTIVTLRLTDVELGYVDLIKEVFSDALGETTCSSEAMRCGLRLGALLAAHYQLLKTLEDCRKAREAREERLRRFSVVQ